MMTRLLRLFLVLAFVGGVADGDLLALQERVQDDLADLRSPNSGTRADAAKNLARTAPPEAVGPLTEAMRDPEVKVRREVVKALRAQLHPDAIDGLLMALRDEDKTIRTDALGGLVDIYILPDQRGPMNKFLGVFKEQQPRPAARPTMRVEEKVVLGLEARLQDDDVTIRRQAAFALGILRAEDAVDSLGAALADLSKEVRAEAVESLALIGGDAAGAQLLTALSEPSSEQLQSQIIEALGRVRYRPAAPQLLQIHETWQGKELADKALTALSLMGAPEARGAFLQNMTSGNAVRRRWAVEGMGRLRDENLKASLTKDFLREPDASVQAAYCFALTLIGRPEFIDRLALNLSSLTLREQSMDYLVELGSPFLVELVPYLSDPVSDVRKSMAYVLEQIGDPEAIPYLKPLLSDPNPQVVDWANRAIATLERVRAAPEPSASTVPST
ncbi:MAG TPA: HEAT repeat domain-containing protein [Vicinamibacteria bacterium]|jgi:HEAT repeat protein